MSHLDQLWIGGLLQLPVLQAPLGGLLGLARPWAAHRVVAPDVHLRKRKEHMLVSTYKVSDAGETTSLISTESGAQHIQAM